jgi:hypothetical protein
MKFDLHQDHVRLAMALDNFGLALNTIGQIVMQIHEMLVKAGYGLPVKDEATAQPSPTLDVLSPPGPSDTPRSERADLQDENSSSTPLDPTPGPDPTQ